MPPSRGLQIEREILDDLGARRHANSGAMQKKHDGSDEYHLYEVKSTQNKSWSFKFKYWVSLGLSSAKRAREPVLILEEDIVDKRSFSKPVRVAMIDYEYFKELKDNYYGS